MKLQLSYLVPEWRCSACRQVAEKKEPRSQFYCQSCIDKYELQRAAARVRRGIEVGRYKPQRFPAPGCRLRGRAPGQTVGCRLQDWLLAAGLPILQPATDPAACNQQFALGPCHATCSLEPGSVGVISPDLDEVGSIYACRYLERAVLMPRKLIMKVLEFLHITIRLRMTQTAGVPLAKYDMKKKLILHATEQAMKKKAILEAQAMKKNAILEAQAASQAHEKAMKKKAALEAQAMKKKAIFEALPHVCLGGTCSCSWRHMLDGDV